MTARQHGRGHHRQSCRSVRSTPGAHPRTWRASTSRPSSAAFGPTRYQPNAGPRDHPGTRTCPRTDFPTCDGACESQLLSRAGSVVWVAITRVQARSITRKIPVRHPLVARATAGRGTCRQPCGHPSVIRISQVTGYFPTGEPRMSSRRRSHRHESGHRCPGPPWDHRGARPRVGVRSRGQRPTNRRLNRAAATQ